MHSVNMAGTHHTVIHGGFAMVRNQIEVAIDSLRMSDPTVSSYLVHVLRILDVLEEEVAQVRIPSHKTLCPLETEP